MGFCNCGIQNIRLALNTFEDILSRRVVCCRWDRDPLARAGTKLVSNDKKETVASAPTLQKALTLMTDVKEAQHVHPNHIMIPLDSETKNVLGARSHHSQLALSVCRHPSKTS